MFLAEVMAAEVPEAGGPGSQGSEWLCLQPRPSPEKDKGSLPCARPSPPGPRELAGGA